MTHVSVLSQESVESLHLHKGAVVVDATFGGGGHSRLIAGHIGSTGRLIAIDQDSGVFEEEHVAELRKLCAFEGVVGNFRNIDTILSSLGVSVIDAALFDLGLSSTQLDLSQRGFSFMKDEPLAMTFKKDPDKDDLTAQVALNTWSAESLEVILKGFADERFARSIAKAIVLGRGGVPIERTGQLVEIIRRATPGWYHHGRTHFATRTFQAIRMAVNDELGAIEAGVTNALKSLKSEGRIAVITFHSVEDRLVKQMFRRLGDEGVVDRVNKKPIVPGKEEIKANPRARSAKLRVVSKI